MDTFILRAVTEELKGELGGAAVRKIFQPNRYDVLLRLKGRGPERRLYISTHPQFCRLHITAHCFANPPAPPRFCLFLRKHLQGRHLLAVENPAYERSVKLTFRRFGDDQGALDLHLIAELMGRHSNLILVDNQGRIQDCINYITAEQSRARQILKDLAYTPPPVQGRPSLSRLGPDEFAALKEAAQAGDAAIIQKSIAGLSPLWAAEILARLLSSSDPERVVGDLHAAYEAADFKPCLYYDPLADRRVLSALPLISQAPLEPMVFESANAAADEYYFHLAFAKALEERKKELKKKIGKENERIQRRIDERKRDLSALEEKLSWNVMGEALKANLYSVKKGMKELEVEWSDGLLRIPLKPELTPTGNLERIFHEYKKSRRGQDIVRPLLAEAEARAAFLEESVFFVEDAEDFAELDELQEDLVAEGVMKPPRRLKTAKRYKEKVRPPGVARFQSASGRLILRGKHSRGNDALVRRLAGERDYWFHARGFPGSHVVLKRDAREEPTEADLQAAAALAAHYSKARRSGSGPVDYTEVRYLKKIKGAPPGFVSYSRHRTLFVNPEENLPAPIIEEDEDNE